MKKIFPFLLLLSVFTNSPSFSQDQIGIGYSTLKVRNASLYGWFRGIQGVYRSGYNEEGWSCTYTFRYYKGQTVSSQIQGLLKSPFIMKPVYDYKTFTQQIRWLMRVGFAVERNFLFGSEDQFVYRAGAGIHILYAGYNEEVDLLDPDYDYGSVVTSGGVGGVYGLNLNTGFSYNLESLGFHLDAETSILQLESGDFVFPGYYNFHFGVTYNF